ncbi:cupin domain-containing protein [Bradyrhizobium sp. Leo170]|uniref:cupin domain-containing protein n=1 Tax=Bradyrhizobium sp. Leo170 TaxID=1571199 RepID=UPI001FE10268|nr:cupin domain-containing protein [Bradyrhizobium sp. Leo170]
MGAVAKKKVTVDNPEIRVGMKMKHRRLLKGLTLKALAELAGCSESMLSRIENGTANPSINTMHRIALALGIPVSGLFQDDEEGADNVVLRRGQRPTIETGELGQGRGTRLEALIPTARGNLLSGYINDIKPGGGSRGTLQHEGEEFGYVLDGAIELTVDNRRYQLREGDSFYFRSERPHSYINNGRRIARVLWVNTPPSF